jgi:hypothetical protein
MTERDRFQSRVAPIESECLQTVPRWRAAARGEIRFGVSSGSWRETLAVAVIARGGRVGAIDWNAFANLLLLYHLHPSKSRKSRGGQPVGRAQPKHAGAVPPGQ